MLIILNYYKTMHHKNLQIMCEHFQKDRQTKRCNFKTPGCKDICLKVSLKRSDNNDKGPVFVGHAFDDRMMI